MLTSPYRLTFARVTCGFTVCALITFGCASAPTSINLNSTQSVVAEMKNNPLGPFDQIRWYCKDGEVLLPKPGACVDHGGGNQHGRWSATARELRAKGFEIATFYADLDLDALITGEQATERVGQMLVERFLQRADDGWIMRRARYLRGAYQEEDERRGARDLLLRLCAPQAWVESDFLVLRTAAATLEHGKETKAVGALRELAASLSARDHAFEPLRNKIHGHLARDDAATVRTYAANLPNNEDYLNLATSIDAFFNNDSRASLAKLKSELPPQSRLAALLSVKVTDSLDQNAANINNLGNLLAAIRDEISAVHNPNLRLQMLDASVSIEAELYRDFANLATDTKTWSRQTRLSALSGLTDALYGVGVLSPRERTALTEEQAHLSEGPLSAPTYERVIHYLALVPSWATQSYRLHFGLAIDKFTEIEPKASLFIQDALRGGPLFHYALLIDGLLQDANRLGGVHTELFGTAIGNGVRGLNPGLAFGTLHIATDAATDVTDPKGIYVLSTTVSDLPPLAGIITGAEGNPLSHIQLLARNLGIPNVAVDEQLFDQLRAHQGQQIVLAVSQRDSVRIALADEATQKLFATNNNASPTTMIKVDLDKLDLNTRRFINLNELRASDSGRLVGPKAAKLGELKFHYPNAVASGIAIPFGIFRAALEQKMPQSDTTLFEWMRSEYAHLAGLEANSEQRRHETEAFRARLESTIAHLDLGQTFKNDLSAKMTEMFGADGTFGVFVRSDTNVEDLPGFTGAGLNLTLPNVVGFDAIFKAITEVWASPFSERSFAWRQSLMDTPEHVYPAVLLLQSVNNDKSGVLVTRDIDSGSDDWLSVAVNEGVGGAVDGQSAESLRINLATHKIRLLAQATAPSRRQLALRGGVQSLRSSGRDQVLANAEAEQLVALARDLPQNFPAIVDASGHTAPADIEFGFVGGALRLFQLRPFLENARARNLAYLQEMDHATSVKSDETVDLKAVP